MQVEKFPNKKLQQRSVCTLILFGIFSLVISITVVVVAVVVIGGYEHEQDKCTSLQIQLSNGSCETCPSHQRPDLVQKTCIDTFSKLWTGKQEVEFIESVQFLGGDKTLGPLLFNASVDGLTSTMFHQKCDGQGPTLTVVKSKEYNRVFGGLTTLDWSTAG